MASLYLHPVGISRLHYKSGNGISGRSVIKSCATRTKMNPFMLIPTLLEGPGFLFCVVKDLGVLIFV